MSYDHSRKTILHHCFLRSLNIQPFQSKPYDFKLHDFSQITVMILTTILQRSYNDLAINKSNLRTIISNRLQCKSTLLNKKSKIFEILIFFYFFKFFFWNIFYCRWRHDEMTSLLKWRIVCTLHSSDWIFRIFIFFVHRVCSELTRRPRIWSYNKWYLIGWRDCSRIGYWYSIMRGRI